MKSYNEIVATCKLLKYLEEEFREEHWEDAEYIYYCYWLPNNETLLPTTYKRIKK